LAEGIETEREAAICLELGFQLGQGFYFSRPAAIETFSAELAAASATNKRPKHSTSSDTVMQSVEDTVESGHQILLDALKSPLERLATGGSAREFRLGK
jgi:c-di-GMP-related signal transduction protein